MGTKHNIRYRKLGMLTSHRMSVMRNLATSIVLNGSIKTTLAKAKEIRPFLEKIITTAKQDCLHSRRKVEKVLYGENAVKKMFTDIGPRFATRNGGYLRILKLGTRHGDCSEMAIVEFVDFNRELSSVTSDKV